jgi:SAM-dependent methyltransferase
MKRLYDRAENRLIYRHRVATPNFWDDTWAGQFPTAAELESVRSTGWADLTKEFLQPGEGLILEGGCGMGVHVAALHNSGYSVIGLDFAEATVNHLKSIAPQLRIEVGDVRRLPFADATFTGYWSLGVIEHFWSGYSEIIAEASRVIQPGGYFFLVFPHMCSMRRWKARLRMVPRWRPGDQPEDFYQFALDSRRVLDCVRPFGFELVEQRPVMTRQGFEEEFPRFYRYMERLYATRYGFFGKLMRRGLHFVAERIKRHCDYSTLLLLRRI